MITYSPDNANDRAFILRMVRDEFPGPKRPAHHPGMNKGWVPAHITLSMNGLLRDGILRQIDVTKPRKNDPTKTITYSYLAENA